MPLNEKPLRFVFDSTAYCIVTNKMNIIGPSTSRSTTDTQAHGCTLSFFSRDLQHRRAIGISITLVTEYRKNARRYITSHSCRRRKNHGALSDDLRFLLHRYISATYAWFPTLRTDSVTWCNAPHRNSTGTMTALADLRSMRKIHGEKFF